jgi:beta-xylosidase
MGRTWTADNGDGTFTNPLFYEEFSDPDIIRVGEDFYMTGTTMHTMPGLPILYSTDLVNWTLLGYALDALDLGPEFRLEGGEIYGQGIWAPCIRYRNGTFYIFSNVNGQKTQIFTATDPRGPWKHSEAEYNYHDLAPSQDRRAGRDAALRHSRHGTRLDAAR